MAKFTVNIDCDNAAFCDDGDATASSAAPELARILREIADKIESGAQYDFSQTIRDINGNDVGRYAIKE
jgi:hypothetical protein